MSNESLTRQNEHVVDYYIDRGKFLDLQELLVKEVETRSPSGDEAIHAVWISQDTDFGNLVRTLEAERFPEMPDVMADFEGQSKFLALVDTRKGSRQIVHAFRLTSKLLANDEVLETEKPEQQQDEIGIALIDDIIQSGQDLTSAQVERYYEERGILLNQCVAVESNFRVEKVKSGSDLRVSDLGYIALFQIFEKTGATNGDGAVFAHLNRPAVFSLGNIGLEYEPIAGREDLKTPTIEEDGTKSFDDHYKPVAIPTTPKNVEIFKGMTLFAAPTVEL